MENIKNTKKQNFFKKAYNAVTNFESYKEFYLEVTSKPIAYLIKLTLLLSLIMSVVFVYKVSVEMKNFLVNVFPDFKYENGVLNFEDTVNIEEDGDLFIIDTSAESEQAIEGYNEKVGLYTNVTIFLKDKVVYKAEGVETMTVQYSELYQNNFSKEDILNLFNGNQSMQIYFAIFLVIFPTMFIVYFLKTIIYVLILSLFGVLSKYIVKINLNYGNIFNICVYGYTLSLILEAIFVILELLTGFQVYRFDMMSTLIAYVYLITALRIIKSDFIKRQEEYARLNMETPVGTVDVDDEKDSGEEENTEN